MTDTPPPSTEPEDDDLLASLYLDGEATADERARVEADPELMARVRAFAAMAGQMPLVTPAPGLREAQIAHALALFDRQSQDRETPSVSTSPISSLDAKRRQSRSGGLPTWLGAAAALALVVGGIGFVSTRATDSNDEAATAEVATDGDSVSASAANRTTLLTEEGDDAMADDAMDGGASDEADTTMMAEAEMASDDAADVASEEEDAGPEEPTDQVGLAPIELDQFSASDAAGYYEFVRDIPPLPLETSPCADSPLVRSLVGVDSSLPVVFDGDVASLIFQAGEPATAVIVGATCEIVLP